MQPETNHINVIQIYRPACSKCGFLTALMRIETSGEPDQDLRTFKCHACGNTETVLIKFR
jgi:predicted RNA-binding Zn-ribbon protein involved in translation (DUF1610 family)